MRNEKYSEGLTLYDTVNEIAELSKLLSDYSHNISKMSAHYLKGEEQDHAIIDLAFETKPNYFFYPLFGHYLYPNKHFIGYHFSGYPNTSLFKFFKATQIRLGYDFTQGEKSIAFSQFLKEHNSIHTEFREERARRNICENAEEDRSQTSLIFKKYLENKTEYFPFHSFSDTQNYLFLQLSSKRFTYNVDHSKASADLLKQTLSHSHLYGVKLGLKNSSHCTTEDEGEFGFENGYTSEISVEYNKNQDDTE